MTRRTASIMFYISGRVRPLEGSPPSCPPLPTWVATSHRKGITVTPTTITELAETVSAFLDNWDKNPPARPSFDAVARALGIAAECTGNPDTAEQSKEWTPKKGLAVQFYTVNSYREENTLANCYYVATWNGATYRGHVVISTVGYHGDEPNGFACYDLCAYGESLPDGCRKLVAQIVTGAVLDSGVSLDDMKAEKANASRHAAIHAALYACDRGARDAIYAEKGSY